MINLIPPQEKKELKREVIFRKVSAIFSLHFISALLLVAVLGFLSGFLLSEARGLQEKVSQGEQQVQSARFQVFKNDAAVLNNLLGKLHNFWQTRIPASTFVNKFYPLLPSDFHLNLLSFRLNYKKIPVPSHVATSTAPAKNKQAGEAEPVPETAFVQTPFGDIRVEGVANSREGLYEFKKTLEKQKEFQDIYFFPFSWVSPLYPNFSLVFSFAPAPLPKQ